MSLADTGMDPCAVTVTLAQLYLALPGTPEFGDTAAIAAKRTVELYEEVIELERPWRNEIPPEYRVDVTWTYDQLTARYEEFRLAALLED